jgi:hypothetical protein
VSRRLKRGAIQPRPKTIHLSATPARRALKVFRGT